MRVRLWAAKGEQAQSEPSDLPVTVLAVVAILALGVLGAVVYARKRKAIKSSSDEEAAFVEDAAFELSD